MSREYPDILGDLVDARQRLEVNGVHYVAGLQPPTIAPGQATALQICLQSCWDLPVEVAITLSLSPPVVPFLSFIQPKTDVPLEAAEVGELSIPIACAPNTPPGEYPINVTVGVGYKNRGQYVRSQKNEGHLSDNLLAFTMGLGLAASVGLGFNARTCADLVLRLGVGGPPEAAAATDMTPTFISHWTVAELPLQGKAQKYVNDQRLYLLSKLSRQPLFMAFMDESKTRFGNAGLALHVGEALFIAKILTFAAEHFLSQADRQDGVLVPAYSLAFRYNLPVSDPVTLITRADYAHIIRLATSLSFGLLRQRLGRDPWFLEEQLAVTDLLASRVEQGGILPAEFLYLPLLLGGLLVAHQVLMPGENVAQSLGLLVKARQARTAELAENPELNAILDLLLKEAAARQ